ncbi:MAG: FAD-dependent oxidoreductase [Myxococcales bacterium]|nr:FAD-dependent oxidoreductase [Myxococcales bacterium]
MARSPLFASLRRYLRRAHAANTLGLSPEEAATARRHGPSRRDFFLGSLGAAALVPLTQACGDNIKPDSADPGIVIVGGGIAGLTAAHFLRLAKVKADVYEASMRIGGRMWTDRTTLASGQLVELGGELVDSDHLVIQALMRSHGLELDDLVEATDGLVQDLFFLNNGMNPPSPSAVIPDATIVSTFMPVALKMAAALMNTAGTDAASVALFEQIDNMSISEWLQDPTIGPGLAKSTMIRRLLEVSYLEEFGLEVGEQSAWNLITLIDSTTTDPFRVFGDSDERYHTHAGNDALPTAMADQLTDQIHLDHALTKIAKTAAGFTLTFMTSAGEHVVEAAHVVYALPFTRLRAVDLTEAGLSAEKLQIINELGYGTNAKLMLQFSSRPWETGVRLSNGSVICDVGDAPNDGSALGSGLQTTWATSRGQDGPEGILTNFVGGHRGELLGEGTAESQAQMVLPWIEQVFPGTAAKYVANSAIRMHWPTYPHVKGSYASYKKGQWAFFGLEGKREGNQHFCGEHCSEDYQGYMEGGAETGAMVAAELLDDLDVGYPAVLAGILSMLVARPRGSYQAGFGERMQPGQIRQRVY